MVVRAKNRNKLVDALKVVFRTRVQFPPPPQKNWILLNLVMDVVKNKNYNNEEFAQILKKTRGAWAGDDWEKTRAKRRKIELAATEKGKKAW